MAGATKATCRDCGAELERIGGEDVIWADVVSGDDGGTYDICPARDELEGKHVPRRELPDVPMYRAMRSGHRNRFGHELEAHLEPSPVAGWAIVRTCCD